VKTLRIFAGIALVGLGAINLSLQARLSDAKADYSALAASNAEAQRLAMVALRARENAHANAVQAITKRGENETRRIAADLRSQHDSLRNRPYLSPDTVPGSAADSVGCSGADLARPDAEFLVRYDSIVAELEDAVGECRARYDAAVKLTAPVLH
jgi:hypothetical protein